MTGKSFTKVVFLILLAVTFVFLTARTALADSQNLIANPSLETPNAAGTAPLGWTAGGWGVNNASFTYPVAGYDGASAAQIVISQYTDGDAKWYFDAVTSVSDNYEFSDYYKSDATSTLTVEMMDASSTVSYINLGTLEPASDWKNADVKFSVKPGTAKITVFHYLASVGTLSVDDFSLEAVTVTPPPPPSDDNLITNPSLEYSDISGSPAAWTKGQWGNNNAVFTYPVSGDNSPKAARIGIGQYTDGDAKWYPNQIAASPNTRYEFSDNYTSTAESKIQAAFLMDDNTYQYKTLELLTAAPAWQTYAGGFTTPASVKAMTIYHLIQSVGTLTVDNYSLAKKPAAGLSQGMVSLDFDDGWLSSYQNAYPIFNAKGLKTTHYVFQNSFDDPEDYISLDDIKAIQAAGNEIGCHGKSHISLTDAGVDLNGEISGAKIWFASNGVAMTSFAYPYGAYNATVEDVAKNSGFESGRTADHGFNDKDSDPYALAIQSVENTTTFPQIKTWIDFALANKQWLILVFHQVLTDTTGVQYGTTPQVAQQIADYLAGQNAKVVTNSEGQEILASVTPAAVCGDGQMNGSEECDSGSANGQACVPEYGATCSYCDDTCVKVELKGAYCGDGIKNGTEACDGTDGVNGEHQKCNSLCRLETIPYCGDGIKNNGEACDGNDGITQHQTCNNACQIVTQAYCGDKIKNAGEECDGTDGLSAGQTCSDDCKIQTGGGTGQPVCGNGIVESGEECDGTAGISHGQTCNSSCRIEQKTNDNNDNDGRGTPHSRPGDWAPGFGPRALRGRVLGASTQRMSFDEILTAVGIIKQIVVGLTEQIKILH